MFWELGSDVLRANKNGLQVRPRPLDLKPDDNHRVGHRELPLPVRHLLQKVPNKLGRHHVLQLNLKKESKSSQEFRHSFWHQSSDLLSAYHPVVHYLVVFQNLNELFASTDQGDASPLVWLMIKLHFSPSHIQLLYTIIPVKKATYLNSIKIQTFKVFSMLNSLVALSTIVRTSSSKLCKLRDRRSDRFVSSDMRNLTLVACMSCCQWRSRMAGFWSSPTACRDVTMFFTMESRPVKASQALVSLSKERMSCRSSARWWVLGTKVEPLYSGHIKTPLFRTY